MKKKSLIIKIVVFVLLASIAIAGGAFLAVNVLQNQKAGNKANVEWYDEDQFLIDTDMVRINLSNEECHFESNNALWNDL